MVRVEVKNANKRKGLGNNAPAKNKKIKLENGKSNTKPSIKPEINPPSQKKITKVSKNKEQKPNNANKQESPKPKQNKKPKPFTLKKELLEQDSKQKTEKRKRKNQFSALIASVKAKEGTKDAEMLKIITDKIDAITSRDELTKTAKRKLSLLTKLKVICEEGSAALSAKTKAAIEEKKLAKAAKVKSDKKTAPVQAAAKPDKKKALMAVPFKKRIKQAEDEDEDDSDVEEDSNAEDSEEADGDSDDEAEAEEDSEDDEGEEDDDDEDDEEEDDSEEEAPPAPAPKGKPPAKQAKTEKQTSSHKQEGTIKESNKNQPNLDDIKKADILKKGQKRFVLFVGNIAYDTTKQELATHFSKAGEIIHIRIPTEKGTNKPRGFAYIEVKNETVYEKCLSMHHSQMKGRRINVMYTQGGKKKGDDKKKEIKAKNMKLHALRKQGKLAGSVKETQKRSFRRNKGRQANAQT